MLFVVALSPLFVKVWRMKQLVGRTNMRRVSISNAQAALYTLPMILIQIGILLTITFLDPPEATQIIEENGSVVVQHIICQANSEALFIAELVLEAGIVIIGCMLAYTTRHMDSNFGEAKQLIFAMYNIALVGVILVLVDSLATVDSSGRSVLQAVGVFWGTVVSSAAFVLPRMVQMRSDQSTGSRGQIRLSGLDPSGTSLPLQQSSRALGLNRSYMESISEEGPLFSEELTPEQSEAFTVANNSDSVSVSASAEKQHGEGSSGSITLPEEEDFPARTPAGHIDEEQPPDSLKKRVVEMASDFESTLISTSSQAEDDISSAGSSARERKRMIESTFQANQQNAQL